MKCFSSLLILLQCLYFSKTDFDNSTSWHTKQWHNSFIIHILKHFQWSKVLLFVDKSMNAHINGLILQEFSHSYIPISIYTSKKWTADLTGYNTVIVYDSSNKIFNFARMKIASKYHPAKWILVTDKTVEKHFFIPDDADSLFPQFNLSESMTHIHRLYSTTDNTMRKLNIGSFNIQTQTFRIKPVHPPLPNLMGKKLRLTSKKFEPYFSPEKFIPMNGGKPNGFYGDILATLQQFINFTFVLDVPEDNQFGVKTANNITGMLGKLCRNESDIGMALTLSGDRVKMIDYSPELTEMNIKILYLQRLGIKQRFFFYLEPLSNVSWICITCLTILVSVVLYLTHQYNGNAVNHNKSKHLKMFVYYLRSCIYTLLKTGASVQVYSSSGHIIMQFFHLFCMLIFINYSSTLTSILTVVKMRVPFESFEELVFDSPYSIATLKGTSVVEKFKLSQNGAFAAAWHKIQTNPGKYLVPSNKVGLDLIHKEKSAYIFEEASVTVDLNGNCSFRFVKKTVYKTHLCLGFRRNFPYRNLFNKHLQLMVENGVMKKIKRDNLPRNHNEVCEGGNATAPLRLPSLVGLFFSLSAGIFASIFILFVEIIMCKFLDY